MPVEDRLRQGLEANATSFTPRGEWRLELVRQRRRRRRTTVVASSLGTAAAVAATGVLLQLGQLSVTGSTPATADDCPSERGRSAPEEDTMDKRTITAAAAVAALASACDPAGSTGNSPSESPAPDSPTSSPAAARLPERGGWGRDATQQAGVALGLPRRTVERLVDRDTVVSLGLSFRQGTFTIWTNDDDWEPAAWDFGTYAFEAGHRLVLTSMSDACPACTTTLTWRSVGDDVVFESVERAEEGDLATWLWQGRWDYSPPE